MARMVLMIDSNAGGVGKSTIAREIAYLMALRRKKTLLIDLDSSSSQTVFNGRPQVAPKDSVVKIFQEGFDGGWPTVPLHGSQYLDACLGSMALERMMAELHGRPRKEYILADVLDDHDPGYELIILDCPGSRTLANQNALAAATHVLFVVELETKSANGLVGLVGWYNENCTTLRLRPRPEIVGLIPSKVNLKGALQRRYHQELLELEKAGQLGMRLFQGIPTSRYIVNSCESGLPLRKYRPGCSTNSAFKELADAIA